ncbi:AAA-domain-containing protein [Rozella allomycis CSF55]|uniref:AAA-domain-containing protein n=1 Tax=Rozella allomycis (strain CSF55) TaxID=988480 RepID=A0A075AUY7_ROZAC|nr:ATPase, AAA-type domain-containing protein [Rozella allomycis CSF55]RKP21848.1 AAA-domain-containing protein [Rozella allomycis CSF55]|eukprot:EPZ32532.1 ATPase, AAA-type domain-containing protein [Rozella allomycis CSF55]
MNESFFDKAFELVNIFDKEHMALDALNNSEVPVGCVFVKDNKIIGTGRNRTNELKNATKHAEIVAIEEILKSHKKEVLKDSVLYFTLDAEMISLAVAAVYWTVMRKKRDFFFGSGSDDKGILSGDENTRPLFSGVFCPDKKFGSTSSRKRKRRLKQIKYDENVREGGYQSDSVITPKKASTKFTYACSSTDSSMGSSREDSFNRLGELEDMNMDKDSENEVKRRYKVLPVNMSSKEVFNALNKRKFRKKSNVFVCDSEKSNTGISFNKIFGLNNHVNRIKEIIFFPLMYPEIFKRLNIRPPNGLLFYGPPVAFFSRKGGDLLDKYIGEGEKQLIELFEMANALQPSIIFFDEIDAPARNSKNQDQSHISLVSTLLGLMDGVTSQSSHVVVIGATNRLDNIDPALRRPGRFDYEMFFPLPNEDTRYEILKNLTVEEFASPYDLSDDFIRELAKRTEGFSGADINGLCKEAAIRGLRKSCSEIYDISKPINYSVEKMKSIIVDSQCFNEAMEKVVGSTTKYSIANPRLKELEPIYYELLSDHFHLALETINNFLHDIPGK